MNSVCIRINDTDVMVIFLGNMEKLQEEIKKCPIFKDRLVGRNRKVVNLNVIYCAFGKPLAGSLPAFHVFTGSDFTLSFSR